MLLARFVSGMPHGAYFGVAALTAASLVPRNERAKAVARAMLGLTIATIIGVPLADQIGQLVGWRWGFALVVAIAVATVLMVQRYVPLDEPAAGKSGLRELRALKNRRVWLTLAISAIGFGGMFAVYTFLSSTLLQVTGVSGVVVSVVLGVFGVGMTIGTLVAAWAADRALMLTAGLILLWSAAALALYPVSTGSVWAVTGVVFCIGCGGGLGTVLQTRLMDVAGEAQTLAAALNHSAFNFANAMGPLLAGMALSHGYGLPSTGYVGCLLTLAGFAVWLLALWEDKYTCTPPCEEDVCLNG